MATTRNFDVPAQREPVESDTDDEVRLSAFEITYYQCRPLPRVTSAGERVLEDDFGFSRVPLGDLYDVTVAQTGALARFDSPRLLAIDAPWLTDEWSSPNVGVSALISSTGFCVLGVRLCWQWADGAGGRPSDVAVRELGSLAHDVPEKSSESLSDSEPVRWRVNHSLDDTAPPLQECEGSVRSAFDLVGWFLHSYVTNPSRRRRLGAQRSVSATERILTCAELYEQGLLDFADVSTWGSHVTACFAGDNTEDSSALCEARSELERSLTASRRLRERMSPGWYRKELAEGSSWAVADFESVLVGIDPASTARDFIEYLALRRGVVSAVHRMVVRNQESKRPLRRAQLARWASQLAIVTDDFRLAGWPSSTLGELHQSSPNTKWHLAEREAQARRQLDALTDRLNVQQARLTWMIAPLAGLIGVVAALSGLEVAVEWVSVSAAERNGFWREPSVRLGVLVAAGLSLVVVSWFMYRLSRSLRPPRNTKRGAR